MDWWQRVKDQKIVVVAGLVIAGIAALGTFLGAINSIAEFVGLGWFDGADGWIASIYSQLTGWLAFQVSLPIWVLLPVLAAVVFITIQLRIDRSKLAQSLAVVMAEREELKQPKPISLSPAQEKVLFWAVVIYNVKETGEGAPLSDIAALSELPLLTIEAALDALKSQGLVKLKKYKLDPVELTPEGRAYMGREEVYLRYDRFANTPGNEKQAI